MSNYNATPNDKEIQNNPEVEEVAPDEPFQLNDAIFLGEIPQNVLDLPLLLGCGRNEQDKRWPARQMTWAQLVSTLSSHKVGTKEGTAFLQGSAIDHMRKSTAIDALYIMGLDIDSGIHFDWAVNRVKELGLSAVLYTTHSHLKNDTFVLESSFGQFARRNKIDAYPTLETMKRFLKEERHWEQWIVDTIELGEEPEQQAIGKGFALRHAPMPKFRIVFPLSEPYRIAKFRGSQADAIDFWKSKLVGLSKVIGLPIDEACLDLARLFYMPRHGKGKPFQVTVTGGKALDFDDIPEGRQRRGEAKPDDNVFKEAAKDLGAGSGKGLKRWAAETADKFDIAKFFREVAPTHIRTDDGGPKLAVDCPFDSAHSNAGDPDDRGTFVQSPGAESGFESFVWSCSHNSCKGRDRLEMIAEAVETGWLSIDDLKDERFVIPGIGKREETPEQALERLKREIDTTFNRGTPMSMFDAMLEQLAAVDASPAQREDIINAAADKMEVKKPGDRRKLASRFTPILKKADAKRNRQKTAEEKEKAAGEKIKESGGKPVLAPKSEGFMPCVKAAFAHLMKLNGDKPSYFSMGGQKVVIHKDANGKTASTTLGERAMVSELNHTCNWVEWKGEDLIPIECPPGVASDIITYRGYDFPRLNRITSIPFFTADGELVVKEGYHAGSGIYYAPPPGFNLPPIPDEPTAEEVRDAVALINDELLYNFPFNDGTGNGQSSRAHANAFLLERFARELIDGFVPIYMYDKPQPGTGASLLVDVITLVSLGKVAPAQTEKRDEDEQRKAFTSFLLRGGEIHRLDNLNKKAAGAVMAMAATLPEWEDRILGGNDMANIPIRNSFVIAGVKVKTSEEVSRRIVPIRLATKGDPKKRREFKHPKLIAWATANRPALVAAALTIIQRWVKLGKPEWTGKTTLASYEPYTAVMGGILECAGIEGFLGNLELARATAANDNQMERELYEAWGLRWGSEIRPVGNPDADMHLKPEKKESLVSLILDNEIAFPLDPEKNGKQQASQLAYWLLEQADVVVEVLPGIDVCVEVMPPDDPRNKRGKANCYKLTCVGYDPEKATKRAERLRIALMDWNEASSDFAEWLRGLEDTTSEMELEQ